MKNKKVLSVLALVFIGSLIGVLVCKYGDRQNLVGNNKTADVNTRADSPVNQYTGEQVYSYNGKQYSIAANGLVEAEDLSSGKKDYFLRINNKLGGGLLADGKLFYTYAKRLYVINLSDIGELNVYFLHLYPNRPEEYKDFQKFTSSLGDFNPFYSDNSEDIKYDIVRPVDYTPETNSLLVIRVRGSRTGEYNEAEMAGGRRFYYQINMSNGSFEYIKECPFGEGADFCKDAAGNEIRS